MAVDLHKALRDLQEQYAKVVEENEDLAKKNAELRSTVDHLKRQLFGRSTERFLYDPNQLRLFEEQLSSEARSELEGLLRKDAERDEDDRSRRNGRRALSKDLERRKVLLDLPEEEKTCLHGHARERFGEDITEELDVIPAKFVVIQYVRPKYKTRGCPYPECRGVMMAPLPSRPIEKGRPGSGLLAHVVVSKYGDHSPLYRQSQIFARSGVTLHRSTLCDWVIRVGELIRPIVEAMKRQLLKGSFLQADETPIRVQKVKKGRTHQAYLWGYGIPWGEVVFDFTMDRSQRHSVKFLDGFKGSLQIDGYDGYNLVFADGTVVRLGCFAHVRRKVHGALKESPEEAKTILAGLQILYRLERRMKEQGLGPAERVSRRRKEAVPVLEDLENLLRTYQEEALPQGALGEALGYALNEWEYLKRYVDVGEAEIDNNSIEHTIRPVALGRKNYLFAGSPRGGEMAANLYSLVTTCKRLKVNPWEYLRDVIDRVSTTPMSRISELTPRGWRETRQDGEGEPDGAEPRS